VKTKSITVRVPATTSNLGPGFDTLGVALSLYNMVKVTRVPERGVTIRSPIAEPDRAAADEMLVDAAQLFFRRTRQSAFGLAVSLRGDVPVARGLGSSVTVRLGVVAALNALTRSGLRRAALLDLVTELEHHPDNAAPAIYGGFTVAGSVGRTVRCLAFPVSPKLRFVALIPRFEVSTEMARRLVPNSFSKADTVHNLNRAALISAAFASGDYAHLRGLFDDRVHQPYRQPLIPQLSRVIQAGEKAGAIGGWLSGSGSTIICLALTNATAVARAMQRQLRNSDTRILAAENVGYKIV
jgi:homoserine kinase